MKKNKKQVLATSELLKTIVDGHERERITLQEIKDSFKERGFGLLFLVFSLPLLIPLPIPTGLGSILCFPLAFFAYQFAVNADSPWLPKWILKKDINIKTFRKIIEKSLPLLRFVEKFSKKRLLTISDSRGGEIAIGIFIILLQVPVMVPMPLSNNIPALAMALIALGMLEKDGVMILIGKFVGVIAWVVFIFFMYIVLYGANKALDHVPLEYRQQVKEQIEPIIEVAPDNSSSNSSVQQPVEERVIPFKRKMPVEGN